MAAALDWPWRRDCHAPFLMMARHAVVIPRVRGLR
jgi:hypothetical protein